MIILSRFRGLCDLQKGSGLDDWIYWHFIHITRDYRQLQSYRCYTLYSSPLHTHYGSQSSLVVSWQRIYNFKSHMKYSFHSLIHFLPLFCNCQYRGLDSIYFLCSQARILSNWLIETWLTFLNWNFPYNHFAWTTQKTQPVSCFEGVFTAPLHSNGSYLIVACIFVAAGMCLPSHCLGMNVCSDFTIPAFGSHVTVF
jgi:hypothetical protein